VPRSSARACTSTSGSLSTYTTCALGSTACATSWVLFGAGRPVPMSRNWRTPASARYRTARPWNFRPSLAATLTVGIICSIIAAESRSAWKWSLPPSQ
jgi:hypothetical protein